MTELAKDRPVGRDPGQLAVPKLRGGSTPERLLWLLCAVGAAQVGLACLTSLLWPFGRDQGIFAWVGDVILRGGTPLVDAWEQKGPAAHYAYALIQLVFGHNMWGVRLFDAVAIALVVMLVARVLRRQCGGLAAVVAGVVLIGLHYRLGFWHTAQPDGWASMASACALMLVLDGGPSRRATLLLSGSLLGFAIMSKLTFAAMLLPVVAHETATGPPHPDRAQRLLTIALGTLASVLAFVTLLAATGALGEYLEIQFLFNPQVHQAVHGRALLGHGGALLDLIGRRGLEIPLVIVLVTLPLTVRRHRGLVQTLSVAFLLAVLTVVVQDKYYAYHAAPLFIPAAALTGIAVAATVEWLTQTDKSPWTWGIAMLVVCAALFSVRPPWDLGGWRAVLSESADLRDYHHRFRTTEGDFSFAMINEVAEYLRGRTEPPERVTVFGFDPTILYLADRSSATRFGFRYALTARPGLELVERYRVEFIREIRRQRPSYIVLADDDANNLLPNTSKSEAMSFELGDILRDGYELETVIGNFELYRRRS